MVYVEFKEKFHGKMIKGTFLRKQPNIEEAKRQIRMWNSLTSRDKIIVKKIHSKRPVGFKKTKYKGIFKKYK